MTDEIQTPEQAAAARFAKIEADQAAKAAAAEADQAAKAAEELKAGVEAQAAKEAAKAAEAAEVESKPLSEAPAAVVVVSDDVHPSRLPPASRPTPN